MLGGKICRWMLLFEGYNFEFILKPRQLNIGPDHLSSIENGEEPTNLEEVLPNVKLFAVHIMDSHFEDIIHFLMKGAASKGFTSQQKKELVVRTTKFSVIARHLYKMGPD